MVKANSGSFTVYPQSMNNNKHILTIWQYGIFISFYLLCCRFIFSSFYQSNTSQAIQLSIIFVMTAGLILYNLRLALFCFIAFIPLMSGLQSLGILKNTCLLSFCFSSMYIAWFPKTVIYKKLALNAKSAVSVCIDLLTTIVLLSLTNHLLLYPSSIAVPAFLYIPVITIHDMQPITASFVFLQGCFLFRLLEIEDDTLKALQSKIIPIFCIQAFTILFFSALQLAFNVPPRIGTPLTAAFQDSHALATYSVFLLFFFLIFSFSQYNFLKAAMIALSLFFLILAVLAYGRSEWAAALLILLIMLYNKMSIRKYVSLISLVFVIVLLINIFPQSFDFSSNHYFKRTKKACFLYLNISAQTMEILQSELFLGSGL